MTQPTKRRSLPLSSYDPRFKQLLLRGALEYFELKAESRWQAVAFRARVHNFRAQAKAHYGAGAPEEWEPLYQCIISVIQRGPHTIIVFKPRRAEFNNLLDQVAIEEPHTPDDLLDQIENEEKS